jgi:hypothetical protein
VERLRPSGGRGLTDAEREAVRFCVTASLPETEKLGGVAGGSAGCDAATLRGLLERMGGDDESTRSGRACPWRGRLSRRTASQCGSATTTALPIGGRTVPLYRHAQPTLTDAEREAVEVAAEAYADDHGERFAATLRGLLDRTQ